MRILVIGRSGQVARSLASTPPEGISIVAMGRPEIDITNPPTLAAAIERLRPDIVVNAAAYNQVDKAERDEATAMAVNADAVGELGRACAAAGVPVIHLSTDYVYDGRKASPYVETDAPSPLGIYGRSKLEGEAQLAEAQPDHIILRTAWVHSPFGENFVRTMLKLAETKREIRVVDDQVGNPTYAPHLATAIIAVASRIGANSGTPPWGIYHAAAAGETSWHGLAVQIFKEAGKQKLDSPRIVPITTAEYPTPAHRPANSRLDCTKLTGVFGVSLPHWTEGVADGVPSLLKAMAAPALPDGAVS